MEYMYAGNRDVAIYGKAGGHLNIFKKGFLEKGRLDLARYLLYPKDVQSAKEVLEGIPHVLLVTPQLDVSGLLSNGRISTIFIGRGLVPSSLKIFLEEMKRRIDPKFFKEVQNEGVLITSANPFAVAVGSSLARMLDLKVGSDAVALTTTVEGQMNALDVEVERIIRGPDALSDKLMAVTFEFAQTLLDTEGTDRLVILLDDARYTETTRDELQRIFLERGLDL